tara:strand:- start:845 stop:1237 length:393 start_codon:yes stop_codon:yes gene_type:complete
VKIYDNNKNLLSIYINDQDFKNEKNFLTDHSISFQVGTFNLDQGNVIQRHVHNKYERKIFKTSEALFMIDGKIKVDLYDIENEFIQTVIVEKGEIIVMLDGGHAIEILEDSKFVEVKQGPYDENSDKNHF